MVHGNHPLPGSAVYIPEQGQAISGNAVVLIVADGLLHAAATLQIRTTQGRPLDAADAFGFNLPDAQYQQGVSAVQDLLLPAPEADD